MKKLFGNIFDNVNTTNQSEFDEFCSLPKDKVYCTQYLYVGSNSDMREEYENIFQSFLESGFTEKNFIQQCQQKNEQFTQRMWELQIFFYLKIHGISSARNISGPDFYFKVGGIDFDIECVAPESGNTAKSVPKFNKSLNEECGPSDSDERIVLRILQALESKFDNKNQGPNLLNTYIIALNTSNIDWEFHPRRIYQALFALKYPESNNHEPWLKTENGIPLGLFINDTYKGVSAIIYTYNHPNHFRKGSTTNAKMYMIHNPFAKFPINRDIFPEFQHVAFNPDTLEIFDGSENSGKIHLGQIINI